jgi:hypothetical protein
VYTAHTLYVDRSLVGIVRSSHGQLARCYSA